MRTGVYEHEMQINFSLHVHIFMDSMVASAHHISSRF